MIQFLSTLVLTLALMYNSIAQTTQDIRRQVDTELISAVSTGDIKSVKVALQQGADVNVRSGLGMSNVTPIMIAAYMSNKPIIKLLYQHGAKVNLQDDDGLTALSKAVLWADPSTIRLLMKLGAEPSRMHRAALTGNLKEVRLYLSKRANLNLADKNGCTPLLLAATSGKSDVVRFLLNRSANPNKADKLGYTPLYQACTYGYVEIVNELLLHHANAHLKPENTNYSAYKIAKIYVHRDIIKLLEAHKIYH